jgi:hypothetical protein
MRKALSPREAAFLSTLAEYRVLSISQLSQLLSASQQMTRRKAGELSKAGLIEVMRQPLTGSAGRPENVAYLRVDGVQTLKEQGAFDPSMPNDLFTKIDFRTLEHQLLTNWFRIHLSLLSGYRPSLTVNFLSPVRHHDWYATGFVGSEPMAGVIPDGAFAISEANHGKTLLFFLEVDMGTETLSSKNPETKDIRKKTLSYQQIFIDSRYKELESPLGGVFKGFRILFVVPSQTRLVQLCRLVAAMPNTGFIWLTDLDSLSQRGVSSAIWVKGGDVEQGHRSILGPSMAFDYTLSPSE